MKKRFIAAAQTDIGIAKQVNQDSLTMKVAKSKGEEIAFAVLCDGMGGLAQGELASAHVVRAFENWFYNSCETWLEQGQNPRQLREQWQQMIQDCNQQIYEYSIKQAQKMGTTLTLVLLTQQKYYIAHIGDCRVYEMKQGIRQLTKDQTYVAREVALGHMTPEQASTDSRRNVLLQCIGASPKVRADFMSGDVLEDAVYLICSDGFRHTVSQKEMVQFCYVNLQNPEYMQHGTTQLAKVMEQQLQYLIELNKNRDEKDNISAILIKTLGE